MSHFTYESEDKYIYSAPPLVTNLTQKLILLTSYYEQLVFFLSSNHHLRSHSFQKLPSSVCGCAADRTRITCCSTDGLFQVQISPKLSRGERIALGIFCLDHQISSYRSLRMSHKGKGRESIQGTSLSYWPGIWFLVLQVSLECWWKWSDMRQVGTKTVAWTFSLCSGMKSEWNSSFCVPCFVHSWRLGWTFSSSHSLKHKLQDGSWIDFLGVFCILPQLCNFIYLFAELYVHGWKWRKFSGTLLLRIFTY